MRTADKLALIMLDDAESLIADLKSIYPAALQVADDITYTASRSDGIAVQTSGISDPTASAALDSRRDLRHKRIKHTRREIKSALTALKSAVAAATNAAES
jgi:hypothetical protein